MIKIFRRFFRKTTNDDILTQWKNIWKDSDNSNQSIFLCQYEKTYQSLAKEAHLNKKRNFIFKSSFVFLLAIYSITLVGFSLYIISKQIETKTLITPFFIANVGICLLIFSILKLLDIFRYQETWARKRWLQSSFELEMIRYVDKLSPYSDTVDCQKLFKERILQLLQQNIDKFTLNLETKEQRLGDELSSILNLCNKS